MALVDTFVRKVKHSGKTAGDKFADGHGLYLLVKSTSKLWRLDYRYSGLRKTLALGAYPAVSLAQARKARDLAREQLAAGIDPGDMKRAAKIASRIALENSFEAVAREFHVTKSSGWSESYAGRWLRLMEKDAFPYLGRLMLPKVTAPVLLDTLRRVERRGTLETAHTLRQMVGQVMRYGVQTGRCEYSPAGDLHGALKPLVTRHMSAVLEPSKAGQLLRAIHGYQGQPATRVALMLSALLFQRPGNIREMEWSWLDLEGGMLTIPSASMKRRIHQKLNGRPHLVPLARQAVEALRDLHPLTGHGRYVFPSLRTGERPMSDGTIGAALRRMGFAPDEMSPHGFRAMARTLLVERIKGVSPDVIEAQLAHGKSGPLGSAYDRADYMDQRREMMRVWADYLDTLRIGGEVIQLRGAA